VISVSSLSKTYGLPGLRLGWIVSHDAALLHQLLCAKEQVILSGSVLDEEVSSQLLARRKQLLPQIRAEIQVRRGIVIDWLQRNADIIACT
ncbi:aminotransferase class I/II-fold pyridoxal phosphate-dependent enzyme, partial [Acinetobacter baumannii]